MKTWLSLPSRVALETARPRWVAQSPHRNLQLTSTQVRIAAVEAFASFFRSITKKTQSNYYTLIPEILNILPPIKDSGDAELLTKALISLIDLAEVAPKMFKPLFNSLVQFSISVIQDKELGETARQNALELMATFADNAPQMCKKDPNFTNDMVTQCLSLMTDVGADDDDAEEWNVSEDLDEESDSNHGRAVHGSSREQDGRTVYSSPNFQLAPTHDDLFSVARQACRTHGNLSHL
jgi:hypothetical protein